MAPIPKPMTATLLLCLAGSILVTAQTFSPYNPASISGCRTTRTPLPPADAFCNVQGRVNSNGTNPNLTVNPGPLATVDQCADLCKTGVANCEFFSFKPNTTRDPFFPENGLTQGTCSTYRSAACNTQLHSTNTEQGSSSSARTTSTCRPVPTRQTRRPSTSTSAATLPLPAAPSTRTAMFMAGTVHCSHVHAPTTSWLLIPTVAAPSHLQASRKTTQAPQTS